MDDGIDDPAAEQGETLEQDVVAALERVLIAEGPLTVAELAARFQAESPQLAADLVAATAEGDLVLELGVLTRQADAFWRIPDGRLAAVLYHLRRATFTHRLSADELEQEAIDLRPDLIALALPSSLTLSDGSQLEIDTGPLDDPRGVDHVAVMGPAGWLSQFSPGDLVAVGYDGEHARIEKLADSAIDEAASQAVAEALRLSFAELRGERSPEAHRLVVDTIGLHPSSFSVPVAPLSELLPTVGLSVRRGWVGPTGTAWRTPPEQLRRDRLDDSLAGADACCQQAAHRALDAWHAWMDAAAEDRDLLLEPAVARRLVDDIDHGLAAAALAQVAALGRPVAQLRGLEEWASELEADTGETCAGLEFLQAVGADAGGDVSRAEAHLNRGLEITPDHPACLLFLAELVEDRGDAQRSLSLIRRTRRPMGQGALRVLEPFVGSGQVGRNEPCPCGSGRKYKACCSGRTIRRPLADRCEWLLTKATRHASQADPLALQSLENLIGTVSGTADQTADLIRDMLLFSYGGLEKYLNARGVLLPEDELACARQWVGQPVRLLDIDAGTAAGVVEYVDAKTGERLSVVEPRADASTSRGDSIVVRALPVGEQWILSSARLAVPARVRDRALELLEGDVGPLALLHLLVDLQVDAIKNA